MLTTIFIKKKKKTTTTLQTKQSIPDPNLNFNLKVFSFTLGKFERYGKRGRDIAVPVRKEQIFFPIVFQ